MGESTGTASQALVERTAHWLMAQALNDADVKGIVRGCCERLHGAGVPIARVQFSFSMLHPLYRGIGYTWQRGPGLRVKLDEFEQNKVTLEGKLAAVPSPAPRLHPNLAELYRRKVADLQSALANPESRSEALAILRGLVERVVLHPIEKGFEIELIGEIAAMVDLGAQNKTAGPKGSAVPDAYRRSA
jgi:hypothetical protein